MTLLYVFMNKPSFSYRLIHILFSRSLGLCPTEREVNELVSMTEDETSTGQVRLERLLPVLTKVMLEKKYRAQPETILMQAFETLDVDKKGYLLPGKVGCVFPMVISSEFRMGEIDLFFF